MGHLTSPLSVPMGRGARVVLAEDDRELRTLLAGMLRRDGYVVAEAVSGWGLLEQLTARAERWDDFDLIISDIVMPEFSGLDVLETLKKVGGLPRAHIPIVLITAFGDEPVHVRARQLGARLFDKPFDLEELRSFVAKVAPPVDELDSLYRDYGGEG